MPYGFILSIYFRQLHYFLLSPATAADGNFDTIQKTCSIGDDGRMEATTSGADPENWPPSKLRVTMATVN